MGKNYYYYHRLWWYVWGAAGARNVCLNSSFNIIVHYINTLHTKHMTVELLWLWSEFYRNYRHYYSIRVPVPVHNPSPFQLPPPPSHVLIRHGRAFFCSAIVHNLTPPVNERFQLQFKCFSRKLNEFSNPPPVVAVAVVLIDRDTIELGAWQTARKRDYSAHSNYSKEQNRFLIPALSLRALGWPGAAFSVRSSIENVLLCLGLTYRRNRFSEKTASTFRFLFIIFYTMSYRLGLVWY